MTDGYIYFFKDIEKDWVKIGYSNNPRKRIWQVSCGSKCSLELLGVMPGSHEIEREIHARFGLFHVPQRYVKGAGKTEWFYLHDSLLNFIRENATIPTQSNALFYLHFSPDEETAKKLRDLAAHYGSKKTALMVALDSLYQHELKTNPVFREQALAHLSPAARRRYS